MWPMLAAVGKLPAMAMWQSWVFLVSPLWVASPRWWGVHVWHEHQISRWIGRGLT